MTAQRETRAMCERVLKMIADRASEARRMHQSFYADDMDDALALIFRQQKEIERLQAELDGIYSAAEDHRFD